MRMNGERVSKRKVKRHLTSSRSLHHRTRIDSDRIGVCVCVCVRVYIDGKTDLKIRLLLQLKSFAHTDKRKEGKFADWSVGVVEFSKIIRRQERVRGDSTSTAVDDDLTALNSASSFFCLLFWLFLFFLKKSFPFFIITCAHETQSVHGPSHIWNLFLTHR